MNKENFLCPLLNREIANPLCLSITYAVEGRIKQHEVAETINWDTAKELCADCGNAYWNRNNLDAPELPDEEQ